MKPATERVNRMPKTEVALLSGLCVCVSVCTHVHVYVYTASAYVHDLSLTTAAAPSLLTCATDLSRCAASLL